jgi:DNA-binding SARP family transcriptional activator
MDFRILGPLEVLDEGRALGLGGRKQRALLALLVLHANETLSADRLIDELWGERPPASSAKTVQVHISRLRKALAGREGNDRAGPIATREHGYRLELDPERLDAHRFERLVAQGRGELAAGRPACAAAALDQALSLWRGPPLADVAYEPFAQGEVARLDEQRVAALEDLVEAKLALGRHAEVIGELERLVTEHPYRERLRAQLMLALYRSERQADALQAYQDARRTLVEELGIEPGERLRELERTILAQDPRLNLELAEDPSAAEPAVEATRGAFVGRERELAELVGGLDDAVAGRGRLFLVSGEPGIGKSRLAEELVAHARARGARVLVGRCWEAGGAPAYWPWVQALRAYVRQAERGALRAQLGAGAADLAHLVPELRELFPDLPEAPLPDSDGARVRLFDATTTFLARLCGARPLVVVLDDLHDADPSSLLLLQFLARELGQSRLFVLGCYRDVDPLVGEPLAAALVELAREPATEQVRLSGLGESELADYIEQVTAVTPPDDVVQAIHAKTEGNPLFVAELVRLLRSEGSLADTPAELRLPAGVRGVIGRRVGRLSERSRDLLVLACVLGREFELRVLERLGELSGDELLEALDEAMSQRLVGGVPGARGRLRFEHALIRETLYDDLSAARRLQLHRRAGEALEALYADRLEPRLSELAHHFCAAAPAGVEQKALDYARRAGDRAVSLLAYEDAVRHYELALTLAEDPRVRCELLVALGEAQARAGDTPASKRSFREAAQLAQHAGLAEELARAALGYGGRLIWEPARDDEEWLPLLERALAGLGPADSPLRVRLLSRLAGGPLREASAARRKSLSDEALEMARRIGDPETLAYALDAYIPANESPANVEEMLALASELLALAQQVDDKERLLEAHEHRLGRLLELGDKPAAQAELAAMAKLAEELRQPAQRWLVATCEARMALLEGRFPEAEQLIEGAVTHGERVHQAITTTCSRLQLYLLRREQGRLGEVRDLVARSIDEYPAHPLWRCLHAQMAAELGLEAEARGAFEALATDDFAGLPFQEMWLVSLGFLAETAAALGDAAGATVLYRLLLPYADRVAVSYPEACTGAVARYLGLLAATMSRPAAAKRHFKDALATNERIGARPWLAHTQHDYARMLISHEAKAGPRAHQLLADALSSYRALGMDAHAGKARALAQLP